jgi:hypothetical protein
MLLAIVNHKMGESLPFRRVQGDRRIELTDHGSLLLEALKRLSKPRPLGLGLVR